MIIEQFLERYTAALKSRSKDIRLDLEFAGELVAEIAKLTNQNNQLLAESNKVLTKKSNEVIQVEIGNRTFK